MAYETQSEWLHRKIKDDIRTIERSMMAYLNETIPNMKLWEKRSLVRGHIRSLNEFVPRVNKIANSRDQFGA